MLKSCLLVLRRTGFFSLVFLCVLVACASSEDQRELYRIRIVNRERGPIEVSSDGGSTFFRVGIVTAPATQSVRGFSASVYADQGTVAAAAVHGIRIKVAGRRECTRDESLVISIVPKEFAVEPTGFGGHRAGSSGIYTDIPTGEAIFRNLAPFVGNTVYLEKNGAMSPMPDGYIPHDRDVLVIVVRVPARYPREIVLQNREGGAVDVVYPDGRETVARVERPVRGIGRFDATGYTGVGRINTNHIGVLTISTAPVASGQKDGAPVETRGGFMIQPSRHGREASEIAQVMIVGPKSPRDPWLEGRPPLFYGLIGLADDPVSGNSYLVTMKSEAGSEWQPFPPLVGKSDDALVRLPGGKGAVSEIRISFPTLSGEWIAEQVKKAAESYRKRSRSAASKSGTLVTDRWVEVTLSRLAQDVDHVCLFVDGELRGVTNVRPYAFRLDTSDMGRGEHVIQLKAMDQSGKVLDMQTRAYYIEP